MQAASGLESLSSYHEGKVHKAEAQLAALEKQVHAQEDAIKSKDEKNIQALKMEVVPLPCSSTATTPAASFPPPPLAGTLSGDQVERRS